MSQPQTANQSDTTTAPTQAPNLTLLTISQAVNIIDVASRRGTFQAGELEVVGRVYNQLRAFVTYANEQATTNQEQASASATTTATTTTTEQSGNQIEQQ